MRTPFFYKIFEALLLRRSLYEYAAAKPESWREGAAVVCVIALAEGLSLTAALREQLGNIGIFALPVAIVYDLTCWIVISAVAFVILRVFSPEADFKRVLRCFGFATAPALLRMFTFVDPYAIAVLVGVWLFATSLVAMQAALRLSFARAAGAAFVLRGVIVWLQHETGLQFL